MAIPLPRRAIALAALVVPAVRPVRAATPPPYRFRILREGSAIGTHRVTFGDAGSDAGSDAGEGRMAAQIDVDIAVRLIGITVFRFTHRFQEVWAGARLQSASSRQDRNGTVTEMSVRAAADALLVNGPAGGASRLPPEAAPLSWWDVARIEARRPLFDNGTGRLLRLSWTRTLLPGGGRRWACTGDGDSAGDYAADGTWIGWTTRAEDGSTVTYVPG